MTFTSDTDYPGWKLLSVAEERLQTAQGRDGIIAVVRSTVRAVCGADGVTFVLRDGDLCHYVEEDAIGPLWKGQRFPMSACISGWAMHHAQTAVIEDNVSILHGVTLGGTGKAGGDRHPKIRYGVLIGAGAKILGNIEIGHCSKIAAGSVVLSAVPHNKTVAGVPAKVVGETGCDQPARQMDQLLPSQTMDHVISFDI